MEIEIEKEKDKATSPITGFVNVNLKVSDGISFGWGFGLSLILWGIIITIIMLFCINYFIKQEAQNLNNQFLKTQSLQRTIK